MIANDFTFNGKKLSDFNLMMSDPEENQEYPSKEVEYGDMTHTRPVPNEFASKYSSPLIISMMVVKDGCLSEDQNNPEFTRKELNDIISWLTNPQNATELIVDTDDDSLQIVYYGTFSVSPFTISDVCFGLKLTFTCNAPYAFSTVKTSSTTINGTTGTVTCVAPEMLESHVAPIIVVESLNGDFGGEALTVTNMLDQSNQMTLIMPDSTNKLTIDCKSKTITGADSQSIPLSKIGLSIPQYDDYNFLSANSFLLNWLTLSSGSNSIKFVFDKSVSNYKVSIISQFPIKAGGF